MAIFTPPFILERPNTGNRLVDSWAKIPRGVTVLKNQDGSYTQLQFPSQDDLAAAAAVYQGGHASVVSDAEATALTNAGYGAYLTAYVPPPGPTSGTVNPANNNGVPLDIYTIEYGVSY